MQSQANSMPTDVVYTSQSPLNCTWEFLDMAEHDALRIDIRGKTCYVTATFHHGSGRWLAIGVYGTRVVRAFGETWHNAVHEWQNRVQHGIDRPPAMPRRPLGRESSATFARRLWA